MKLRWPEFEKSVRRRAREKVRASPALRLEAKRNRKARNYHLGPWIYRFMFLLVCLANFNNLTRGWLAFNTVAVTVLGWVAGSVFWRASRLVVLLHYSAGLEVYRYLPLSDAQICGLRWQAFLKGSLWSVIDFTAGYGLLASRVGFGFGSSFAIGLVMAVGQWQVMITLAAMLAAFRPKFSFPAIGMALAFTPMAVVLFAPSYQPTFTRWLYPLVEWMPGLGWSLHALGVGFGHGWLDQLGPTLATGLAVCCLQPVYWKIRRDFRLREPATTDAPATGTKAARPGAEVPKPAAAGSEAEMFAALQASIRTRNFLAAPEWEKMGWLERAGGRWLTPREKLVTEFLGAGRVSWTHGWKSVCLVLLVVFAACWVFPALVRFSLVWVYVPVFYLNKTLSGQVWPGTAPVKMGGLQMSICSIYPLGFREMLRVILKKNLLRSSILPVLGAGAFVICTLRLDYPPGATLAWVLKILALALVLQPIATLIPLSTGTNDTSRVRLMPLFIIFTLAILGCGIGYLFLGGWWRPVALLAVIGLLLFAFLRLYEFAYNRHWFDLMRKEGAKSFTVQTSDFGRKAQ